MVRVAFFIGLFFFGMNGFASDKVVIVVPPLPPMDTGIGVVGY